ncbi:Arm DNA-binding domain-containing protein [[Flexibacter] sp. ATCC 35208]|uniref:Arm DNA-binding domain-containing protein n=1 Tax=[Flexibacter] sp. ATCC 35208 TaxID=1936242 RepID=UPI0009CFF259|nr:Arm DNA-binding domain-containing protein [[Flexibacter] sp. ATCC 35208]OMP74967.1 hypothetical protein BW716_32610 [[Flexibacter] sp. ATCC 35208]
MNVKQNLAILFFLRRGKKTKTGMVPIYVRVTIDGLADDISTGCKISEHSWDTINKQVLPTAPSHKQTNKTLGQIKSDLERHFDLVQVKEGLANPIQVFESYKSPINGTQIKNEKIQTLAFSEALDTLINKFFKFSDKKTKAYEFDQIPSPEKNSSLTRKNQA